MQDVWHWVKNFAKALAEGCKRKAQKPLMEWIPEIKNHVWWASQNCGGDADLLVEMVLSIQFHIVDKHDDFPGHSRFLRCQHEPIPPYVIIKLLS